ncbi:MAG: type II toxin-antitoxin system HicB family antitoxin [Thermoplasmata archaeon]
MKYTVILEPQSSGGYTVTVPALPGCISEGDTFDEAIENIKDAITGYIESLRKHGQPIPVETAVEVPISA